jgi:gas vesicle protein
MGERNRFSSFLSGFIAGGLVGAIVAFLYAPAPGEETRALIRDKSIELRDRAEMGAERASAEARARADELARQLKERGREAIDKASERARATREASEPGGAGDGPPA